MRKSTGWLNEEGILRLDLGAEEAVPLRDDLTVIVLKYLGE
ncbi:hypothetical protein [Treponema succinifaciens]